MSLVYKKFSVPALSHKKPHKYVLKTRGKKILLPSDSYCPIPNLKRETKICRRLSTSFLKREIRKLHVVVHVIKKRQKDVPKSVIQGAKLLFYLLNLPGFFDVLVKLPNQSVFE